MILIIANATGFFNLIFTGDSALYAYISKHFCVSGDYLNIYVDSKDWLDKPHFPFWLCAVSMKLFGFNTFAYKLPSFLLFLVTLFYVYRFAKQLYNVETAQLATLIFGSALHIIISNNDVRAEAILMGLLVAAVYHMYQLSLHFSWRDLLFCSLFCAAAVMTKGIFILIIVYAAVFGNYIIKKQFRSLFYLRWLSVFLLTMLFITPELYALYIQFDLYPEKVVFGKTNVSGLQFFFWDSQFGRFFNTGPIKGSGDPFFFFHTMIWAFAPWAILAYIALVRYVQRIFTAAQSTEFVCLFGFLPMFLIFSISKFQLPHYTNIIFPFLAIMVSALFCGIKVPNWLNKVKKYSILLNGFIFAVVIIVLQLLFDPGCTVLFAFVLLFLVVLFVVSLRCKTNFNWFIFGVLCSVILTIYLNFIFLPKLLSYQSESAVAVYLNDNNPKATLLVNNNPRLVYYYADNPVQYVGDTTDVKKHKKGTLLFADTNFLNKVKRAGIQYKIIKPFEHYHITRLNGTFLNSKTRKKVLDHRYLVQLI